MADYSTPTVIEPLIPLSAMKPIERMFLAKVFEEEVLGDSVYYFSSDGANDSISLAAADVRAALVEGSQDRCLVHKLIEEQAGACIDRDDIELDGCGDHWPDVLQEIVRRAPGLDHLTVTMAFTCSKMRSDGFGGLSMMITAATIRWGSTSTLFDRFYEEAYANGEISHGDT